MSTRSGCVVSLLIVDDEADARDTLRLLLGMHGFKEVAVAVDGEQALDLLRGPAGAATDVVISDIAMPRRDGIELCKAVKADADLHDIPFLMLTGQTTEEVMQAAFEAGAHDFVPKGVAYYELLARVRSALSLKRELDARKCRERELVDLTHKLERMNERLNRLSMLDDLTNAPNRRFFNVLFRQEWARASREGLPLSILMCDIDWFKRFNDRYGHPAGDECLCRVASALAAAVHRPGDVAARFGGEEFIVLLANTGPDGAATVAESVRGAVSAMRIEHADSPFRHVTMSVGMASTMPTHDGSPDDLLRTADRGLYQAKERGRNRAESIIENVADTPV